MSREAWLAALGVTDWRQRRPLVAAGSGVQRAPSAIAELDPIEDASAGLPAAEVPLAGSAHVELIEPEPPPPPPRTAPGADTWDQLGAEVASCTRCPLHTSRNCTVFGVGDRQARWLIVGEAPGAEEDRQGEPFVGRAGKLLDSMLLAIGLQRSQVFIANILKCRPPDNRNPQPAEVAQCMPYLKRQIALLQPSIMLAVGSVAAQNLLATDTPVGRLRGRVHAFGESRTPLVVTYHPAYLLRSPGEKRRAWEDLKFARRVAAGQAT
jgi:uracil-DNA glycosylase family 4